MRSLAVSLERNLSCSKPFKTEPYEAGWASEARWFIHVFEIEEGTRLIVRPQVSFDGLFWCDYDETREETRELVVGQRGLYSMVMTRFGQWLRLKVDLAGNGPKEAGSAGLHVQLVLKG